MAKDSEGHPVGNTDPSKRGRGGKPDMGQPPKPMKEKQHPGHPHRPTR